MFSEHRFALSQIEAMTPQALSILANHTDWPIFSVGSRSTMGGKLTSDYNDEFAVAFAQAKRLTNRPDIERLKHSISELISRRFIEAYVDQNGDVRCQGTPAGLSIIPYLTDVYR